MFISEEELKDKLDRKDIESIMIFITYELLNNDYNDITKFYLLYYFDNIFYKYPAFLFRFKWLYNKMIYSSETQTKKKIQKNIFVRNSLTELSSFICVADKNNDKLEIMEWNEKYHNKISNFIKGYYIYKKEYIMKMRPEDGKMSKEEFIFYNIFFDMLQNNEFVLIDIENVYIIFSYMNYLIQKKKHIFIYFFDDIVKIDYSKYDISNYFDIIIYFYKKFKWKSKEKLQFFNNCLYNLIFYSFTNKNEKIWEYDNYMNNIIYQSVLNNNNVFLNLNPSEIDNYIEKRNKEKEKEEKEKEKELKKNKKNKKKLKKTKNDDSNDNKTNIINNNNTNKFFFSYIRNDEERQDFLDSFYREIKNKEQEKDNILESYKSINIDKK